jgi:sugar phosphate isomerase/epimerase
MTEQTCVFSTFTKTWKDLPLPELAKLLAGFGFDGLELPVRPGCQVVPERIEADLPLAVRIMGDQGLRILSVAGDRDERTIAALAKAGIPMLRTMVPIEDDGYLASEARARREIDSLVPILSAHGVKLGVQHHVGRFVCNAMGLLHLIEAYDPACVGAVWDAAHAGLNGEEPEMGIDIVWRYLCQVNLKNGYWERTNGPEAPEAEWKHHLTTGRHGLTSWSRTAAELKRRGYRGVVCLPVEYDDRSLATASRLVPIDLAYAKSLFE